MANEVFSLFDLVPGKVLGERYRIVGPSRQSGLSAAFEVALEEGGERLEMTVFPSALFDNANQVEEYRRFLEPWKTVQSPHVTRVVDIISVFNTTLALITEYPGGESLREWLREDERFEPTRVRRLGIQLCQGLECIHAAGLVHGDIKPHTIHISEGRKGFQAQLVDGGVTPGLWNAKQLGEHTALIGTPFYAPVEQFGGDSPDVRSDIYNVATVLFELVCGMLPWPGSSFLEVFQAKLDKNPPLMRARAPGVEVDPALEQAIVGGLMADRRERYQSAREFRLELEAADLSK
jgi:serine/threonine-protein kinase